MSDATLVLREWAQAIRGDWGGIDEDDPVYLRGHSVGIRDGIQIGRVMAAYDVGWLSAWSMRADALNLTDGMRLVRLNDAVKAARGDLA